MLFRSVHKPDWRFLVAFALDFAFDRYLVVLSFQMKSFFGRCWGALVGFLACRVMAVAIVTPSSTSRPRRTAAYGTASSTVAALYDILSLRKEFLTAGAPSSVADPVSSLHS